MRKLAAIAAVCALMAPAVARAQLPGSGSGSPQPQPYRQNDFGGFRNVLPPGEAGFDNAADLAAFEAGGQRPAHTDDQIPLYRDLLYGYPSLGSDSDLDRYFKDASFGVKPGDAERTYNPRPDVTVVRDKYDVPHIYADTRAGAEFGLGYVTAEDRLFFIDVFRHLGRGELASFAGGAPSNRQLDAEVWSVAPYTEADLQQQVNYRPPGYEQQSDQLRGDLENYVAGVNQYIAEARLDPLKMPAEYAAIGKPLEDWKTSDVVATADVVGAIFGAGGGGELPAALALEDAQARFGRRGGKRVWSDFRSAIDPEAPTTVTGRRFPYQNEPRRPRGVAMPDRGSVRDLNVQTPAATGQEQRRLLAFPSANSNALVVSAARSASGRPLAVFGPQVAYFMPEIVMEQDVHAPGLDARGVAFPGTNLYVQLGHGRDYAWSATSAGQDITDTFALPLCEPGGAKPTIESMHYLYRGRCLPIEVLTRTESWQPNLADSTPAGTQTLTAQRTALGIVAGRATVHGRPVAYVRLRTTYRHETDSALGFAYFNDPSKVHDAASFQQAASLIGYTFNWFYVDDRDTAYFNSGFDPMRAPRVDTSLPIWGRSAFEWRGFNPATGVPTYLPASAHPQAIDQPVMTSWNNKQAPGVSASEDNWGYGSTYRSVMLDQGIRSALRRGGGKVTLWQLVQAMEDAATIDLRGDVVLPWLLRVIGHPHDPALRSAIDTLAAWRRSGAHRIDRDQRGGYDDARAVELMDAWWPLLVRAEFVPVLGEKLFADIKGINEISNNPNNAGQHLGSAYQAGWYGYVLKDLRTLLHRHVRGRYSRVYCGRGSLRRCRAALLASLRTALKVDPKKLYSDDICAKAGRDGDQTCYDAIYFRPLGAITQPLLPWQNRPTFQQVVEVQGHRPR